MTERKRRRGGGGREWRMRNESGMEDEGKRMNQ